MQPLTAPPREHLTEDEVRDLLTRDDVTISAGVELLDGRNQLVDDISASLGAGGNVAHEGREVVHGRCNLPLLQALAWGRDRVRVYVILSDRPLSQNPTMQARFNLGVYVLTTPQTKRGEDPVSYDVQGYDLLQPLLNPVGDTYVVLPAEGVDAIANGDFEAGITGWESNSQFATRATATLASSTSHPASGTKSLEVTWASTAAAPTPNTWVNTLCSFVVGKTYRFEVDAWVPLDGPNEFRFEVDFIAASGWFVPTKGATNHFEWLWTATAASGFPGLGTRNTVAGTKTWIDRFRAIPLSTTCLDAVRNVLELAGVGAPLLVDGTQQPAVLDGPMVWGLTEGDTTTWLDIINDLLDAISYRNLWVDQDGNYRTEPYQDPKTLPVEWPFDVQDEKTNLVGPERTSEQDVWSSANLWTFVRRDMATMPVEGDGIYTVANLDRGPSSQQSLGRVVRKTVYLDAVDQASLVAQGDRVVVEDTAAARKVTLQVDPLPTAGHLDVVQYVDGPISVKAEVVSWVLNLDGSPGTWVLEVMD